MIAMKWLVAFPALLVIFIVTSMLELLQWVLRYSEPKPLSWRWHFYLTISEWLGRLDKWGNDIGDWLEIPE